MKYQIRNNTTKTLFIESSAQWNNLILKPGEVVAVPESAMDQFLVTFPGMLTVIGPFVDTNAPVAITVTLSGTWQLVTLGRFCTMFKFITTATNCLVSFSGWNTALGETAPDVKYQIPIIPTGGQTDGQSFDFDMPMDSNKSFYVKGTGTLTIIGS